MAATDEQMATLLEDAKKALQKEFTGTFQIQEEKIRKLEQEKKEEAEKMMKQIAEMKEIIKSFGSRPLPGTPAGDKEEKTGDEEEGGLPSVRRNPFPPFAGVQQTFISTPTNAQQQQQQQGDGNAGPRNLNEAFGMTSEPKSKMRGFDYKNQIKPEQFDGSTEQFQGWNELFTTLLASLDDKWETIIDEIIKQKTTIKEEEVKTILQKLDLGEHVNMINSTMFASLLQYTKGDAHAKVVSNGKKRSLDSYRWLYVKGRNETTRNCMDVMTKVMQPDGTNDLASVEKVINKWKEDIRYIMDSGEDQPLTEKQMKTILVRLVPDDLADHLIRKYEHESYEMLEKEAITVADRSLKDKAPKKKQLGAITEMSSQEEEPLQEQWWDDWYGGFIGMAVPAQKRRRENDEEDMDTSGDGGKGKSKGKGKGPKDGCFTCGGDHYASKCPKGKGKGKGKSDYGKGAGKDFKGKGGGKSWFPTRTWNQFYPGPSPSTWSSWYPYQGGKGGGKSPKGGKSGMGFMGDTQYTPDGQPMTFQPLGNMAHNHEDEWCAYENWGAIPRICGLFKGEPSTNLQSKGAQEEMEAEDFKEVKNKKNKKKFVKFTEADETIHKAQSYESDNKFKVLQQQQKNDKMMKSNSTLEPSFPDQPAADEKKNAKMEASVPGGLECEKLRRGQPKVKPMQAAMDDEGTKVNLKKHHEEIRKDLQLLCRAPTEAPLNHFGESKDDKWKRVSMAVDSGACETVADPTHIPCDVLETNASRAGASFVSATGEPIPNMGEMDMSMITREGTTRSMKVQAAPVTKPLASVMRIVQAGHVVVFDEEASYILNKRTGEVNLLREEDGNYMLDVWVKPTRAVFTRQR